MHNKVADASRLAQGLLYKNGMDITLAYEHEMNYRHMWEFFVNGYLQWAECASCGHICPESFWRNYRSYGFGVAYKPCMTRGRNHYGSLRIGASAGSDMNKVPRWPALRLRTQLCATGRMDTVLASEKRCDDKRCGRAASRCRAGCETTYKIGKQKKKAI